MIDELKGQKDEYYVAVGGVTPTPIGEGKSTTTVGLCQALGPFLDKKVHTLLNISINISLELVDIHMTLNGKTFIS